MRDFAGLRAEGMGWYEVRRKVRLGQLERLRRGTYLQPGEAVDAVDRHLHLISATMPLLHPDAVLSHLSAGLIHGLPVPLTDLSRVTVLRPGSGQGGRTTNVHLRRDELPESDVDREDTLPLTTLGRTTADLGRTLSYERAVMVLDHALSRDVSSDEVAHHLTSRPGRRGNARLRSALDFADPLSESPGETLTRIRLAQWGIPSPELQYEVRDGDEVVARCDFAWPELGIVGEFDGDIKYGRLLRPGQDPQDAVIAEKRREDAIRALGWLVIRWCWKDLNSDQIFPQMWRRVLSVASRSRRSRP